MKQVPARTGRSAASGIALAGCALWLSGCAAWLPEPPPEPDPAVSALTERITTLQRTVSDMNRQLLSLHSDQGAVAEQLARQTQDVERLAGSLAELPAELQGLCPAPAARGTQCPPAEIQKVMVADDKMVVGERERVWLDPPGTSLNAHIDTGMSNNVLYADEVVAFERDGEQWVRFGLPADLDAGASMLEVERAVKRFARGGNGGPRRPVIAMRLRLGDVQGSFEFVLTEPTRDSYQLMLGRNFLTDIALVDVGRQFVQPAYQPRPPAAEPAALPTSGSEQRSE